MTPHSLRFFSLMVGAALGALPGLRAAADPTRGGILPVPADVRQILDQRCTMCHGETIDGKVEVREDLDLTTDEKIRETLAEPGKLKQMILEDEMPQKAKLSFRLRREASHKQRLEKIQAEYAASTEKERLLAWLKEVVATTGKKKEKE